MRKHKITLIPGDGTGPEVAAAAKLCIESSGINVEWDIQHAGVDIIDKEGTPLPEKVIESIKENKVALKGPITTPVGYGFRSVNVSLRKKLDLYACVRPSKYYKGVKAPYEGVDITIVRENTEDLYAGIEYEKGSQEALDFIKFAAARGETIREDSGISIKPISVFCSRRIVQHAFDYARSNGRKKVTAVHKANIMKYTDGLFLSVAREVASENSDIEFEDRIVDNMTMQLVQKPHLYDVLVLPNLYGDIISDLCAGLTGGLGIAPGANIGNDTALFEPTHGSAPKYKGQNKVNPTATILSGVMMLRYIDETEAADRLENAVAAVIEEGKDVTYDLKPAGASDACGTMQMAEAICRKMNDQ